MHPGGVQLPSGSELNVTREKGVPPIPEGWWDLSEGPCAWPRNLRGHISLDSVPTLCPQTCSHSHSSLLKAPIPTSIPYFDGEKVEAFRDSPFILFPTSTDLATPALSLPSLMLHGGKWPHDRPKTKPGLETEFVCPHTLFPIP